MGIITKGMGAVLKHIKRPGKAFMKGGDEWFKKTKKLQASKKKSEKIRGAARIIVPMAGAATVGGALGVHDAKEEIRKRGVYGVGRKDVGPKTIYKDIKKVIKKVTKK